MRIVRHIRDLKLDHSVKVGLVPTMGAFHEGHLSLMRKARAECDVVMVSLFVNPTQFAPGEDFDRYPRDEARDFAMAEAVGVDVLFAPSVKEIYPRKTTKIYVSGAATRWEGEHRPGHFDGVATVVCKLFNLIQPDLAYFGIKDFQQCAVIKQMVEDLNLPVQLSIEETLRESDGLAMSSRNVYLTEGQRAIANQLYGQLKNSLAEIHNGADVAQALNSARYKLENLGFEVEYLAAVDADSLEPVAGPPQNVRIITAARLGNVRLIDNVG